MPLYLGLDSSTQSLTAIVIDSDSKAVVYESSLNFDQELPQYGTAHGVLPRAGGSPSTPPRPGGARS